jgi:hypothetical protein
MQGADQVFDILRRVALMLLHHKCLDLSPGDTLELLGAKRGQEMVTHNTPHDACGRGFARDRHIVCQPPLSIVAKGDGLGSGVDESYLS